MATTLLPVKLFCTDRTEQRGEVAIEEFSTRERTLRATKIWGILWALALASVILPLAHFFLVPGFLIAGPLVAYFTFRQERVLRGGNGVCPSCYAEFEVARGPVKWPKSDVCVRCRSDVRITLAE